MRVTVGNGAWHPPPDGPVNACILKNRMEACGREGICGAVTLLELALSHLGGQGPSNSNFNKTPLPGSLPSAITPSTNPNGAEWWQAPLSLTHTAPFSERREGHRGPGRPHVLGQIGLPTGRQLRQTQE